MEQVKMETTDKYLPVIILVGKSGSGKTTLATYLEDHYNLTSIASYTTRPPRYAGEKGHTFIDYHEYLELPNKIAKTYFNHHYYCATKEQFEQCDIYVLDPDGVDSLSHNYDGDRRYKVFYLDVPWHMRLKRMLKRGDSFSSAIKRLVHDRKKFKNFNKRQYVIVLKDANVKTWAARIMYLIKYGNTYK